MHAGRRAPKRTSGCRVADPPANLADFRGLDSSVILILRGGIPRPIGDSPEDLSQAMFVGIMLVGRLGVGAKVGIARRSTAWKAPAPVRPISLLRLSLLRFVDSTFPGIPLWSWEVRPLA